MLCEIFTDINVWIEIRKNEKKHLSLGQISLEDESYHALLHAWRVAFRQPFGTKTINVTAPLPDDMADYMKLISKDDHSSGVGTVLLLITAAFGMTGIAIDVTAMIQSDTEGGFIPGIAILIAGITVYILLLFGTKIFLHRVVTTELILIVGWTMLEVAVANSAFGYGVFKGSDVLVFLTIVALAAVSSLVLYLMYYTVKQATGYIFGMIPLITEAITMGVYIIMTR